LRVTLGNLICLMFGRRCGLRHHPSHDPRMECHAVLAYLRCGVLRHTVDWSRNFFHTRLDFAKIEIASSDAIGADYHPWNHSEDDDCMVASNGQTAKRGHPSQALKNDSGFRSGRFSNDSVWYDNSSQAVIH